MCIALTGDVLSSLHTRVPACHGCSRRQACVPAPCNLELEARRLALVFNAQQRAIAITEPSRPVASPPFSPNWRLCPSQPLRGRRNAPRPLINTAAASHFPPLPQSDPKNKNRAAPAFSASEPNPREPLLHSPFCLATSSYTLPRSHFASSPSPCATTPSPPRSFFPADDTRPWTAWHEPSLPQPFAL